MNEQLDKLYQLTKLEHLKNLINDLIPAFSSNITNKKNINQQKKANNYLILFNIIILIINKLITHKNYLINTELNNTETENIYDYYFKNLYDITIKISDEIKKILK